MRNGDCRDYSNISVVIQGKKPTPVKKSISSPPRKATHNSSSPQRDKFVWDKDSYSSSSSIYPHKVNSKKDGPFYDDETMNAADGNMRAAAATTRRVKTPQSTSSHSAWPLLNALRLILLDLPLTCLFATLLTVYAIRNIYQDLYVPLMDRATRTDEDLEQEFTYYHRYCTEADLTTRNINDLVADTKAPVSQAVEQMMEHGGVVIRDLLSQETVRKMREYAVYRNNAIPEEEVYPVSQGRNRMSFGYDATENPIVVQALKELSNNRFLKQLLSEILGDDDPASSEITTITAYYNAPPQAWHSDTKEDGNALKFARTYSHSYSLFLPLQNTVSFG